MLMARAALAQALVASAATLGQEVSVAMRAMVLVLTSALVVVAVVAVRTLVRAMAR